MLDRTWDGLPVASDEPHGAAIVVRRLGPSGDHEYLLLHRAHRGPGYAGDWAWTPPSGARLPGEPVLAGALRELAEEAGLTRAVPVPVDLSGEWAVFLAEVCDDAHVRLDAEHDQFRWMSAAAAARRCRPAGVATSITLAAARPRYDLAFSEITEDDLPDLAAFSRADGPRAWGARPGRAHVALASGEICAHLRHYESTGDLASAAGQVGPALIALEYAIGGAQQPGLGPDLGLGLGTQVIWRYLLSEVLPASPHADLIVALPGNVGSPAAGDLAMAGFTLGSADAVAGPPGREEGLWALDRRRVFGC